MDAMSALVLIWLAKSAMLGLLSTSGTASRAATARMAERRSSSCFSNSCFTEPAFTYGWWRGGDCHHMLIHNVLLNTMCIIDFTNKNTHISVLSAMETVLFEHLVCMEASRLFRGHYDQTDFKQVRLTFGLYPPSFALLHCTYAVYNKDGATHLVSIVFLIFFIFHTYNLSCSFILVWVHVALNMYLTWAAVTPEFPLWGSIKDYLILSYLKICGSLISDRRRQKQVTGEFSEMTTVASSAVAFI